MHQDSEFQLLEGLARYKMQQDKDFQLLEGLSRYLLTKMHRASVKAAKELCIPFPNWVRMWSGPV